VLDKNVEIKNKTILVTGAAGFIGANLVLELLKNCSPVNIIGIDNLNDYYGVNIKNYRLDEIQKTAEQHPESIWSFLKGSIADKVCVDAVFRDYRPSIVVNLAAQAGVRYSITNPDVYIESNLIGFYNILEACRHSYCDGNRGVEHLVYASSSSVYGSNKKVPYSVEDKVDNPVSLYAATKKSNELLAHAYSKLYNIPSTGLRFFTVYGPAGRPDMAYFGFTNKLRNNQILYTTGVEEIVLCVIIRRCCNNHHLGILIGQLTVCRRCQTQRLIRQVLLDLVILDWRLAAVNQVALPLCVIYRIDFVVLCEKHCE